MPLYFALCELENRWKGTEKKLEANGRRRGEVRPVSINMTFARGKFASYARRELTKVRAQDDYQDLLDAEQPPAAVQQPPAAVPILDELEQKAFASMNHVGPAQKAFLKETLETRGDPGDWPNMWAHPPDPMMRAFSEKTADAMALLPICFWSPKAMFGVEIPCARCGWEGSDHVTVRRYWSEQRCASATTAAALHTAAAAAAAATPRPIAPLPIHPTRGVRALVPSLG